MSVIVERLDCDCNSDDCTFKFAAAEIKRLTAENERLRAALKIADDELKQGMWVAAHTAIRAALEPRT